MQNNNNNNNNNNKRCFGEEEEEEEEEVSPVINAAVAYKNAAAALKIAAAAYENAAAAYENAAAVAENAAAAAAVAENDAALLKKLLAEKAVGNALHALHEFQEKAPDNLCHWTSEDHRENKRLKNELLNCHKRARNGKGKQPIMPMRKTLA